MEDSPLTPLRLQAAEQFRKREGNLEVPSDWNEPVGGEYISLGSWIKDVRRGRAEVSDDTREKLDKLGMRWGNIRNTDTQMKLQAAEQFHKREGNLEVPSHWKELVDGEYISLGDWIADVRKEHTGVDADTREKLDKLGMRWEPVEGNPATTRLRLKAAEQFRKREGHLNVPSDWKEPVDGEYVSLGSWLKHVRGSETKVDDETREKLDKLGMRWDKIRKRIDIQLRLQAAEQFYKREGDLKVPSDWKEPVDGEYISLGSWIKDVRRGRIELDDAKRAILDGMSMRW
ncbi:helicase associated domain-containing protein, partial [Actinacidiphila sp. bgisy167]|uniref:helicase associated domain-containing protein n=1 Tax=Actinacidiphila sp. bgisy167 TaxID=3413797 RepID=UPI003D765009